MLVLKIPHTPLGHNNQFELFCVWRWPAKSILIRMDHCSHLTPMIEFIGQTDSRRHAGPQLDSVDWKEV
jgi:hypothetical protein